MKILYTVCDFKKRRNGKVAKHPLGNFDNLEDACRFGDWLNFDHIEFTIVPHLVEAI